MENIKQKWCEENNGFGPVFNDRRKKPVVIAGLILLSAVLLSRNDCDAIVFYSFITSSVIFGQFLRKLLLFVEEFSHLNTRHEGKIKNALLECLGIFKLRKAIVIAITAIFVSTSVIYWTSNNNEVVLYTWHFYFTCSILSGFLPYALGINFDGKLSVYNDMRLKFVADGQAWGYFFGFLKIIFGRWESNINLAGADKDFTQPETGIAYRDLLSDKRLFIVIPKNGDCYRKFEELDNITFETKMPEIRCYRAGVQERSYRNTLYRIDRGEDKKPLYVLMEYATPLLNMHEMAKECDIPFTLEDREEQVTEFYNTLQMILNKYESETKGKYALVLTGPGEDLKNGKRKLGDIISDLVESTKLNLEN